MEPPYEEQYRQEGNPRAYMTMRDYRNLAWQNQQPLGRNPNQNRSMMDYRDQWMSAPVYSVPSTYPPPPQYDHPEPPFYASTPQSPQPPQSIPPFEQAILDLTKLVGDVVEEQKKINAQLSQKIDTMKNNVNKRIDGLQSEMEQKLDNLQYSISKLAQHLDHPEEESQEDECLTETILGEQVQLQPHEELKVESLEALEELQEAPVTFWPWTKEEQISALITEESSGHETGEEPQEPILQPIPMKLNPSATAQPQNNLLPVAPSVDQVYILPSPAPQPTPATKSKPAAPAPKGKSNRSLHAMQNLRKLVAIAQAFATISKTRAAAYISWHSGWFGCGFGFGTLGPRHF